MTLQKTKEKKFLNANLIFKYLSSENETLDTLVMCNPKEAYIYTFDQSLYEALGSFDDRSQINHNKLVKLLEVMEVLPYRTVMKTKRKVLTQERAEEIKFGGNKNE